MGTEPDALAGARGAAAGIPVATPCPRWAGRSAGRARSPAGRWPRPPLGLRVTLLPALGQDSGGWSGRLEGGAVAGGGGAGGAAGASAVSSPQDSRSEHERQYLLCQGPGSVENTELVKSPRWGRARLPLAWVLPGTAAPSVACGRAVEGPGWASVSGRGRAEVGSIVAVVPGASAWGHGQLGQRQSPGALTLPPFRSEYLVMLMPPNQEEET